MKNRLSMNSFELLSEFLSLKEKDMARLVLKNTFFIDPRLASTVVFPNFARPSNEFHPGKKKKDLSFFNGREVRITDNLKARDAFGKLTGLKLNGDGRKVAKGWDVAHIWGHVYDPDCFTAGWNMCLMPNFFRDLTEEQNSQEYFQKVIQQVSFNLYFKTGGEKRGFIKDHRLDLDELISSGDINILSPLRSIKVA
jgi:hypothetical protein